MILIPLIIMGNDICVSMYRNGMTKFQQRKREISRGHNLNLEEPGRLPCLSVILSVCE
jgi:hypothetical protein